MTGPPSILLVKAFQGPCCVVVIVKTEPGNVIVTGIVDITVVADVIG